MQNEHQICSRLEQNKRAKKKRFLPVLKECEYTKNWLPLSVFVLQSPDFTLALQTLYDFKRKLIM